MEYRELGKTGLSVGAISFGTEHLLHVDRAEVDAVVGLALERGVNYFDLVWALPEFRDGLAAALRGRRQDVLLTCHLNSCVKDGQYLRTNNVDLCRANVDDWLARYHTDYIDVLFIHNVNLLRSYQDLLRPRGIMELAHQYRREGVARCIGLSGHLSEVCIHPVQEELIDVLMLPLNMTSHGEPHRRALLQACLDHEVSAVAMKAFAGGKLLQPRRTIEFSRYATGGPKLKKKVPASLTPVRCLSYVLTQPAVATAVAGWANCAELEASLAHLDASDEEKDFAGAIAGFEEYHAGECVYCNHCLPCPAGIDIGLVSRLVDAYTPALQARYDALPAQASACTGCGACVQRCPFEVDIMAIIERAVRVYEAA